jgi:multidrug efflux pump
VGGRASNSQYQYTLFADNIGDLDTWSERLLEKLRTLPEIRDANTSLQNKGLESRLTVASRLGLSASDIDEALYDSYGQRDYTLLR